MTEEATVPCEDGRHIESGNPRYIGWCARCGKEIPRAATPLPEIGQMFYLAGPMSGVPQFNIPAFDAAATHLRGLGYEIISPAELDEPETRRVALLSPDGSPGTGVANGETWGDFLARDVKLIADGHLDGVIVLPDWGRSRGARLETFIAYRLSHMPVYSYLASDPQPLQPTPREALDAAHTRT